MPCLTLCKAAADHMRLSSPVCAQWSPCETCGKWPHVASSCWEPGWERLISSWRKVRWGSRVQGSRSHKMPGDSKDNCSCGFPGWPEVGQARAGLHAALRLLAAPEPWRTKKSLCAGIGLSFSFERFYTMLRLRASCSPESSPDSAAWCLEAS